MKNVNDIIKKVHEIEDSNTYLWCIDLCKVYIGRVPLLDSSLLYELIDYCLEHIGKPFVEMMD